MKKLFLFGMVAALAGTMNAQTIDWTTTAEQTVKSFVSARVDHGQLIASEAGLLVEGVNFKLDQFVVEGLTTATDLTGLPKFAEVNKMMVQGINLHSENQNFSLEAYLENTNEVAIRNLDAAIGETTLPADEFKVANMTEMTMPGGEEYGYIVELPFDIKPFYYLGDAAYITLNMQTPEEVIFELSLASAEVEVPVVYRNNFIPFYAGMSDENDKVPSVYKPAFKEIVNTLDIQKNMIPAYELEYYTHDINGTVADESGAPVAGADVVVTVGNDTYTATSGDDGKFVIEGLDYTQPCTITVTNGNESASAEMNFGSNANDIIVNVVTSPVTAIENVNAGKTVASVSYYDLTGRMSNEPINGVNVMITRYTDGTASVVKMVR